MNQEELTPHLEELKRVLNNKVDDETILKELDVYLNKYHLDIDAAKRGIVRKYGDEKTPFVTGNNVVKKINEIEGHESNVDIVAKVISADERTVNVRGNSKNITSGFIADSTGSIAYTIWESGADLDPGSVYRFKNCSAKTWNDTVQLNINSKGSISREDGVQIVVSDDIAAKARFTGSGQTTAAGVEKKIADIVGDEPNLDVIGKIVYVEKKEVTVKGSQRKLTSGIIGDETGSTSFSYWDTDKDIQKGEIYRFKGCYARKWNDRVQITVGTRGTVEKVENVTIDMPERNYSMASHEMKIGEIREGVGNVTVTGRILTTESNERNIKGEMKTVYSGMIADETGKIQYSAWSDFGLKEGETVCIKNAYVRAWKSIPQLNIGEKAEISRVDDIFDEDKLAGSSEKTVAEIVKNGGGVDITIKGTVVDMRLGSGLIKRCPQCNRSIQNDECINHGHVTPKHDLRMKVVIDDGTGSISATLNRDCTKALTNVTLEQAEQIANMRGADIVAKNLLNMIIAKRVKVTGNVMSDEYGPMMVVSTACIDNVDIKAEAEKLLKEVEEAL